MIKLNSAIPLYQQVAEDLKNRIEQGEFCSGQSIPSVQISPDRCEYFV